MKPDADSRGSETLDEFRLGFTPETSAIQTVYSGNNDGVPFFFDFLENVLRTAAFGIHNCINGIEVI